MRHVQPPASKPTARGSSGSVTGIHGESGARPVHAAWAEIVNRQHAAYIERHGDGGAAWVP